QGTDRPAPRYLLPMTDPTAPAERRRPLRIAQVAPPLEPVPPAGYGGTERIIEALVRAQIARGHDVTLFASGDSTASASRLVPTVPRALRPAGTVPDPWSGYMIATEVTALRHAGEFDVIHAPLESAGLLLARASSVPVVNTFHGPRDRLFAESYATLMPGSWPEPFGLVAIESLACGTPVLALPSGALPETIRDGVDGFLRSDAGALAAAVPRVAELDRAAIRASVLDRFSAARMAAGYEAVYRRGIAGAGRDRG